MSKAQEVGSLPKRFSLPARGEAASTGKPAWLCCWFRAVAAVVAPHSSYAQLVHGSRPGLDCPSLTDREGHGRMGSKVTNWKFMIVFVEDKGQGTEIPMFLQRCAFITVSLSQFKCLFEQRFLFLQRDSVPYILNELAANGTIAIV